MKTTDVRLKGTQRLKRWGRVALVLGAVLTLGGMLASAAAPPKPKGGPGMILSAAALAKSELFTLPAAKWEDPPEAPRPGPTPFPLVVDFAHNKVRVGTDGKLQDVRLRSYNGHLVGPTFRVKPGETLKIDLVNRLPKPAHALAHASMDTCGIHERPDITNLHTHGLHISPSGESDDPLREIEPGGPGAPPAHYVFQILPAGNPPGEPPLMHHPGTDWYHAHLHGSTGTQLASGMAGALLVEGDIDEIPAVKAAKERIFVFQQLAFDKDGEIKSFNDLNGNWTGAVPDKNGPKKHTTINGVVKPSIPMRPGQVERWRMIDAGVFRLLELWLVKEGGRTAVPFHQLAVDGITLRRVRTADQIELAPGYRVDALVKAPDEPGVYLLYNGKPRLNLLAFAADAKVQQAAEPEILAEVRVDGEPCSSPAHPCSTALVDEKTELPAPFKDIGPVSLPVKTVTFSVPVEAGKAKFQINGECFHSDHVMPEFDLKKGSVEEWVLRNTSKGPHPFHIHVNPFQMVNSDGTPGDWRDTLIVPPPPGKELRIRTRIERFTGKFVLHCHILTHEDQGMMQLVVVK